MQAAERPDQNENRKRDAEQPQQQVPSHLTLLLCPLSFTNCAEETRKPRIRFQAPGFPRAAVCFGCHRPTEQLGNTLALGFAAMPKVALRVRLYGGWQ